MGRSFRIFTPWALGAVQGAPELKMARGEGRHPPLNPRMLAMGMEFNSGPFGGHHLGGDLCPPITFRGFSIKFQPYWVEHGMRLLFEAKMHGSWGKRKVLGHPALQSLRFSFEAWSCYLQRTSACQHMASILICSHV